MLLILVKFAKFVENWKAIYSVVEFMSFEKKKCSQKLNVLLILSLLSFYRNPAEIFLICLGHMFILVRFYTFDSPKVLRGVYCLLGQSLSRVDFTEIVFMSCGRMLNSVYSARVWFNLDGKAHVLLSSWRRSDLCGMRLVSIRRQFECCATWG